MKHLVLRSKIIISALAFLILSIILIAPIRRYSAKRAADRFAIETGISTSYSVRPDIGSKEAFLTEIWKLAEWEQETRTSLNDAYGYSDSDLSGRDKDEPSGYADKEELLAYAMKDRWRKERGILSTNIYAGIDDLFDGSNDMYGISSQAVRTCYSEDFLYRVADVMRQAENGDGKEAYNLARYNLDKDWAALPMDVAYGLKPELIFEGCVEVLASAVESNDQYDLKRIVSSARNFEERYGVTVDGLDRAESKLKRLEYSSKPDAPKAGMSVYDARSTKLGKPTRTTQDTGSWSHKKHTFGDMYWDKDGKQIYKAHYYDGMITDVWDTRNSTAARPSYAPPSSDDSRRSVDPEDYDIEAYYEDNYDDYEDYEDAYDGFEEDEDAWDDYAY